MIQHLHTQHISSLGGDTEAAESCVELRGHRVSETLLHLHQHTDLVFFYKYFF